MLSVKNLRVDARLDVEALELISGEITLVLGPNGAGKSTLRVNNWILHFLLKRLF